MNLEWQSSWQQADCHLIYIYLRPICLDRKRI